MENIILDVSKAQMRKLRKGEKIRAKKGMQGSGVSLLVNPHNYSVLNRAFSKNKGAEIMLTVDELVANQMQGMDGGKLTYVSKIPNYKVKASVSTGGKVSAFNKSSKWLGGIEQVYDSMAKRLRPVSKPLADIGFEYLETKANPNEQYIEAGTEIIKSFAPTAPPPTSSPYLLPTPVATPPTPASPASNVGGPSAPMPNSLSAMAETQRNIDVLNKMTGQTMGSQTQAGLAIVDTNKASADLNKDGILSYAERQRLKSQGQGLRYAGVGLTYGGKLTFGGRCYTGGKITGQVGAINARVTAPALASQPFHQNFHQQFQLPMEFRYK